MNHELTMSFPALEAIEDVVHAFTLRHPAINVQADRAEAIHNLSTWHDEVLRERFGLPPSSLMLAEQVHGAKIAVVDQGLENPAPGADGLVCAGSGVVLGIHVADCCAVYLVDRASDAIGLVHSGKKGTELNIVGAAIRALAENFGSRPEDMVIQLSPCIRPPSYEVDFAATIRGQARREGVPRENIHDDGICTSSDPSRFYSYRMEKGRTGRMLALLGRS